MDKTFPAFSELRQASKIKERLNERTASGLNAWISVASARKPGLVLHSNDDGGFDFHYGNGNKAGASGRKWDGKQVGGGEEGYYPAAYVDSLEIEGNYDDLSRKASFSLVAHTQTQANELIKHFLEPGYTVFLQWGWNTDKSNGKLIRNLADNISKIASYTNQKKSDIARSNSTWEYDNYVGFISGGNVTLEGNKWKISVQCYGFTELPMQLKVADTVYKTAEIQQGGQGGEMYQASEIYSNRNNANGRFMMMFNELPSNKRTSFVKQKLYGDSYMKKLVNYINFDASVLEAVANKASFSFSSKIASAWAQATQSFTFGGVGLASTGNATVAFFKSLFSGTSVETGEGGETEIEAGVKLVHEERFMRFGALIRIINSTGAKGYKLEDGTKIIFQIDSSGVIISAFERIFSTKKEILFIPNPRTPRFSIKFALENTVAQTDFSQIKDNTVEGVSDKIIFPQPIAIPPAGTYNPPHADGTGISRNAYTWGYLDDLYVNFDFAMEIIKNKNLSMRDGIIQILNGLSTAAGGIWDFQLIDSVDKNGNLTIRIEDFNLTSSTPVTPLATFKISGPECPFIDTSMDMDIAGDVMNAVIGERNSDSAKMNSTDVSQKGQAGTAVEDYILNAIETDKPKGAKSSTTNDLSTLPEEEQAIAQKRNYEKFMELVGIYPKVKYTAAGIDTKANLDDITYIGALDDLAVFESFKLASDTAKVDKKGVGPLIPINFTFTVHGVSGVRLGDTFAVAGIVGSYSEGGFFQVTSVKHSISGMVWTTSITGGWRPNR
jgi:hypothetical protein